MSGLTDCKKNQNTAERKKGGEYGKKKVIEEGH
jgi:hypothetical protein